MNITTICYLRAAMPRSKKPPKSKKKGPYTGTQSPNDEYKSAIIDTLKRLPPENQKEFLEQEVLNVNSLENSGMKKSRKEVLTYLLWVNVCVQQRRKKLAIEKTQIIRDLEPPPGWTIRKHTQTALDCVYHEETGMVSFAPLLILSVEQQAVGPEDFIITEVQAACGNTNRPIRRLILKAASWQKSTETDRTIPDNDKTDEHVLDNGSMASSKETAPNSKNQNVYRKSFRKEFRKKLEGLSRQDARDFLELEIENAKKIGAGTPDNKLSVLNDLLGELDGVPRPLQSHGPGNISRWMLQQPLPSWTMHVHTQTDLECLYHQTSGVLSFVPFIQLTDEQRKAGFDQSNISKPQYLSSFMHKDVVIKLAAATANAGGATSTAMEEGKDVEHDRVTQESFNN